MLHHFFFFILQVRERELANARKADEEYRRLEHLRGRLYRQEEEMRKKEQEARERRLERVDIQRKHTPPIPASRGFTAL